MNLLRCGYTRDQVAEFWALVARGDRDECWMWMGYLNRQLGDRAYFISTDRSRKSRVAARVAWEMTHGLISSRETYVCHRCDRPWCVNPHHLFLGTAKENIEDSVRKGRHSSVHRHLAKVARIQREAVA